MISEETLDVSPGISENFKILRKKSSSYFLNMWGILFTKFLSKEYLIS